MYSYQVVKFKNGLRALLVPNNDIETVQVTVLVRAGGLYEPKKLNGISHFLEHMAFKGTKKRPTSFILTRQLDSIGASYNAYTGYEYTGYWIKTSKKHLKLAIDILADIYLHSIYPPEEIEKEKGVVIEEINLYRDDPTTYVWDLWTDLLYGDTPAGRELAGTKENVNRFTRQDLINYHHALYRAKSSLITISGNFNPSQSIDLIKKYFKDIKEGEGYNFFPTPEKQKKPALKIKFRKTDQTHIVLGVRSFNYFNPGRYALDILNTILDGGISGLLFQLVREKLGAAYYLNAEPQYFADHGYWAINCGLNNEKLIQVLSSILKECKSLTGKNATPERLKVAKNNLAGRWALYSETPHNYARYLANELLLKNKIELPSKYLTEINKVTLTDVKRMAAKLLKPERLNLALVGPHKNERALQKILNF